MVFSYVENILKKLILYIYNIIYLGIKGIRIVTSDYLGVLIGHIYI